MAISMQRLTTAQLAIRISIAVHLGALICMAWQKASVLLRTDFAGQRQAVTVAATFAPPVPLSEPEPVEVVRSELDDVESTTDVEPDSTVAKQSPTLVATVDVSELLVPDRATTPPVARADRRRFQQQEEEVRPEMARLPRKSHPITHATMASAVPIPVGTQKETPPDFSMNPPPKYPAEAARNGWQGEVILRLLVALDGSVSQVVVAKSSGYSILDEAALHAVRRWKAIPATRGGEPVAVVKLIPVQFIP